MRRRPSLRSPLPAASGEAAVGAALLERYVVAVNAHDTAPFPELFTEGYVQHSGRSPSGLAAQIENFKRILATMPDVRLKVEDCIVSGNKVVARITYSTLRRTSGIVARMRLKFSICAASPEGLRPECWT